ncbi:MAG: hypothetical protein IH983_10140 [Planctomycetes bacterium]|nr:hypothetical protein [Planctomycetota bacterium]
MKLSAIERAAGTATDEHPGVKLLFDENLSHRRAVAPQTAQPAYVAQRYRVVLFAALGVFFGILTSLPAHPADRMSGYRVFAFCIASTATIGYASDNA